MVYVGTLRPPASKGIYACRFDPEAGKLDAATLAAETNRLDFLTLSPDKKFLYATGLDATGGRSAGVVCAFAVNPQTGKNVLVVHANGRFLHGSNRGHDSIGVFAIDPAAGTLTNVEYVATQGRTPRNFAIDPTGKRLFAANQDSNSLVLFRVAPDTGQLQPSGVTVEVPAPCRVDFAPLDGSLGRRPSRSVCANN